MSRSGRRALLEWFASPAVFALAGALLAVSARVSGHADVVGEEIVVNQWTAGPQSSPSVAMDHSGSFVVVWQSGSFQEGGPDGSQSAVRARRFDANGQPKGDEFAVNTTVTGSQGLPVVAAQPAGAFLVAWQGDENAVNGFMGVFARRYRADGTADATEFVLNEDAYLNQNRPSVAALDDGRFVVAWADTREIDGAILYPTAIPPKRFDLSSSDPRNSTIAPLTRDSFVVVWANYYGSRYGVGSALHGATVSASGDVGPQFQVGLSQGFYGLYGYVDNGLAGFGVAADRAGRFVVAHSAYVSGYLDHSDYPYSYIPGYSLGARTQRFVDGESGESEIVSAASGNPWGVDVASVPAGDYIVVWNDHLSEPLPETSGAADLDGLAILAREFRCDGTPKRTAEMQINSFTTGEQLSPAIAIAPNGDGVIVWTSERSPDDYDIAAQRIRLTNRCALCGDANDDGVVRAADALAALRAALQAFECELARCDVDASGTVTASDALAILADSIGLRVALACGA